MLSKSHIYFFYSSIVIFLLESFALGGVHYKNGLIAFDKKIYEKAASEFLKEAEQGADDQIDALRRILQLFQQGQIHAEFFDEKIFLLFQWMASKQNPIDLYNLAILYSQGLGTPQNLAQAIKYCSQAAEKGYDEAQYGLAYSYEHGRGTPQNFKRAVQYYTLAADQGHINAQARLGRAYYFGELELQKDETISWEYLALASSQGHLEATSNFAFLLHHQNIDQLSEIEQCNHLKKVISLYTQAAHQGNDFAQLQLGIIYENTLEDFPNALKNYKLAAEKGNSLAQFHLGRFLKNGIGENKDLKLAECYFFRAAEQQLPEAQYEMGLISEHNSHDLESESCEAFRYFQSAAEKNYAPAFSKVAFCYLDGKGTPQNYESAFRYFLAGAQTQDPFSQNYLGYLYEKGLGTHKDIKQALDWYKKSADQGLGIAQYNLGLLLKQDSLEVNPDYQQAKHYLELAAEQGILWAHYHLALIYKSGILTTDKPDYEEALKHYINFILQIEGIKLIENKNFLDKNYQTLGQMYYDIGMMYESGQVENKVPQLDKAKEYYRKSALYDKNGLGYERYLKLSPPESTIKTQVIDKFVNVFKQITQYKQ